MKYLKTFEGHGRVEFSKDGKQAICGPAALPQSWNWEEGQTVGFDPESMLMQNDTSYNYLWDENDHLDQKDVDKMIEPHNKKNGFGFNPMNESSEVKHINYGKSPSQILKSRIESIKYIVEDEGISINYTTKKLKLKGLLFSFNLLFNGKPIIDKSSFYEKNKDICGEFFDRIQNICEDEGFSLKRSNKFDEYYIIKKYD